MGSRRSLQVDVKELMTDGLLEIEPFVEQKGLMFFQFQRSKLNIVAGPYVGLIPLTKNVLVEIHPRLPVHNLGLVLERSETSLAHVPGFTRTYRSIDLRRPTVLDFMTTNLVDGLREVETNGLLKQYIRKEAISSQPRGRIKPQATIRSCWSRGRREYVSSEKFEQSSDIPENRVMKSALEYAAQNISFENRELRRSANAQIIRFPSSVSAAKKSDISSAEATLRARRLPSHREYYYRPLEIAVALLGGKGISFEQRGDDIRLGSFILNFEELFENFLRNVLRSRVPTTLSILDGNMEGKKPLFDDQRNPPAKPDIVVRSADGNYPAIAEVKYKESVSRNDINQAITYAASYRAKTIFLVHQNEASAPSGISKIGEIGEVVLFKYAFNLANPSLEEEEESFAREFFSRTAT